MRPRASRARIVHGPIVISWRRETDPPAVERRGCEAGPRRLPLPGVGLPGPRPVASFASLPAIRPQAAASAA
jgi:hypothetical protein